MHSAGLELPDMKDMLVWIDCEMTGLDLANDELMEVACLVTDGELNVQGEGVDVLVQPSKHAMDHMGPFVTEMHTKSGLLDDLKSVTTTMREAEEQVLAYIKKYVPTERKAPLAGNTIGTDRTFLAKDMPELEAWVHYRHVGVGSVKQLAQRWYPLSERSEYFEARPAMSLFLRKIGRRKLIMPTYEALAATPDGLAFATQVFRMARPGYHPITSGSVDAVLAKARAAQDKK